MLTFFNFFRIFLSSFLVDSLAVFSSLGSSLIIEGLFLSFAAPAFLTEAVLGATILVGALFLAQTS